MITITAPPGIDEIQPGDDLAEMINAAVRANQDSLRDGDIICVTSKIISKAEARSRPATEVRAALAAETADLVARRAGVRIVRNHQGITQAAAGIDGSNVAADAILLLPEDPDASAERLRAELQALTGTRIGVVITDTAGRAWRIGQIDHAIGCSGVRATLSYVGHSDPYGNDLRVTEMAVADELAAASDLAKAKLSQRPFAIIRGLAHLVTDETFAARALQRSPHDDLFARGTREAVLFAILASSGCQNRFAELAELDGEELITSTIEAVDGDPATIRAILATVA